MTLPHSIASLKLILASSYVALSLNLPREAIKELKRMPAPSEEAGAAWAKMRDRVVTLMRKVKEMVEPQTVEVIYVAENEACVCKKK